MRAYLDLLREVRETGVPRGDRTGTGTLALFGRQLRFDLEQGFPAVTTKRLFLRSVIHELLWFLRGESNVAYLREHGVHIWDAWADAEGELGPVYGVQWRAWPTPDGGSLDQLSRIVAEIRSHPDSRRLLVSAWNAAELERMALEPCHVLFQFHVSAGRLSIQVYQRSADVFLGLPFNIASYALLGAMVAQVTGLERGELVHTLGDVHLYTNHLDAADLQLSRSPLSLPSLQLDVNCKTLDDFRYEHVRVCDYRYHPAIPAPIAV